MFRRFAAVLAVVLIVSPAPIRADVPAPLDLHALHWRNIGPFRAGRTVAVAGVHGGASGTAGTIYIGATDGGVWRSTNLGRTWTPIFDGQPTGSIGAIAVAPSQPSTVYVGSGEALQRPDLSVGDGMYKSTDGGATWTHLGLRDSQQIGAVVVDPRDPQRVYVAALGHPYGPNAERGVFRSTDGGATFVKVLGPNDDTGAIALAIDPKSPDTLYASLWVARQPPWDPSGSAELPGSGLWKSTDGGTTWHELTTGLPVGRGRIGLAIAPSVPSRLYALVDAPANTGGVFRSDDAGATWRRTDSEMRVWSRGQDFAGIAVDPDDPDLVYVCNTTTYRSTDGAASFAALKGAPGGDDYHTPWIDSQNRNVIVLASDQGATVSTDRGTSWSSWYNQPTAQFYHVAADDRFPYRVYGGQQESGSIGTLSRGDSGRVTFRDWHSVGVEEYGYVAPDPLHPWLIYGGKASVFDERTGQTRDVSPEAVRSGAHRYVRTMPIMFAPADPHRLLLGLDVVMDTRDGGMHWRTISPDLARKDAPAPASFTPFLGHERERAPHRGVVYALAPSARDGKRLWAGTDDGLVWTTADDGAHWRNVTPPALTPWSKVAQIDAGRFDAQTAYVAVTRLRIDDLHPYVYRTHDGGRSWTLAVDGLPVDEPVNAVREDPLRRGLLYAATEHGVYVSLDDGAHWSSLRTDLPPTSVRDIVVHGDDLVIGTHGRSFWILDDITPLRQLAALALPARATLFAPARAVRVRGNLNTDTPLPPEEPGGENPPDGAIFDYTLPAPAGSLALEVRDARGTLVRRLAADDDVTPTDPRSLNVPTYWLRSPSVPPLGAGLHRFVWDLHERAPLAFDHEYPIAAAPHDTPREPRGPLALPGRYTLRLVVDGAPAGDRDFDLRNDPRSPVPLADLQREHDLAIAVRDAMDRAFRENKRPLNARLGFLLGVIDGADGAPTAAAYAAYDQARRALVSGVDLPAFRSGGRQHRATAAP